MIIIIAQHAVKHTLPIQKAEFFLTEEVEGATSCFFLLSASVFLNAI